jgi:hypothetical protein
MLRLVVAVVLMDGVIGGMLMLLLTALVAVAMMMVHAIMVMVAMAMVSLAVVDVRWAVLVGGGRKRVTGWGSHGRMLLDSCPPLGSRASLPGLARRGRERRGWPLSALAHNPLLYP